MFYILLTLICLVFFYAMFLDNKNKIEISYDVESSYNDDDFHLIPQIIFKADKKRYHFKAAFIGISVENNFNENIIVNRDYEIEIKKDDKWYKLNVENNEDVSKEISIKFKENFYQNIFIDKYKNLSDCDLRIIKKFKVNDELKTMKIIVSIHSLKAIKEK